MLQPWCSGDAVAFLQSSSREDARAAAQLGLHALHQVLPGLSFSTNQMLLAQAYLK